jgi:hypothetical protein
MGSYLWRGGGPSFWANGGRRKMTGTVNGAAAWGRLVAEREEREEEERVVQWIKFGLVTSTYLA